MADVEFDESSHHFEDGREYGVAMADDGTYVAYQHGDGDIHVHEVGGDWELVTDDLSVYETFQAIDFDAQGEYLAVESPGTGEVVIVETEDWEEVQRVDGQPQSEGPTDIKAHAQIQFSADGSRLIVPSADDDAVYLYERPDLL